MANAEEELLAWLPKRDPHKLYLFIAGDAYSPLPLRDPKQSGPWRERFTALRSAQAGALFALAQEAAEQDRLSLAMMFAHEAIRENPHHAAARRTLGYVQFDDRWCTPHQRRMFESGHVWDERFGWLTKEELRRYEAGMRKFGRRWIDAEQEARIRRNLRRGWEVRTGHYRVTTNHSLEEGVRLARRFERLYQVWRQLFVGYDVRPAVVRRAFAGRGSLPHSDTPQEVVYFRNRSEYNDALRAAQPQIDITLGIYFDNQRRAYFFAGDDQQAGTLYHEAVHQLFQESRPVGKNVGARHNFWIVEGIATYFESLTGREGYFTLGGSDAGRLPAARHRLLVTRFYVPFEKLVRFGTKDLQRHPEIAKLYSQIAGQTTFLMHFEQGRYRRALVEYLTAVYEGEAHLRSLSELTGASYDELDRQYRAFIESTHDTLQR